MSWTSTCGKASTLTLLVASQNPADMTDYVLVHGGWARPGAGKPSCRGWHRRVGGCSRRLSPGSPNERTRTWPHPGDPRQPVLRAGTRLRTRQDDGAPRHRAPVARIAQPRPPGTDASDVYQLGGSLRLSGVFAGLHGARLHHDGGSALFRLPVGDQLHGFLMPSVALDALLRALVLDGGHPDSITILVPTAIREITIHTAGNDLELARQWGADITLRHYSDAAGGAGRCLATAPDGTVLFSMDGLSGSPRETYDLVSGRWLTAAGLLS